MSESRTPDASNRPEPCAFRDIVDGVPTMVFTFGPEGGTEFVNRAVLEYFGLTLDELRAWQGSGNIFHPDEIDAVTAFWTRAIAARVPYSYEHRLRRADGMYRWFQLRATPHFDAEGNVVRWYGALTDIEDLKRLEIDLHANERALAALIDSVPAHVFTTTADGTLDWANRHATAYHGAALQEPGAWISVHTVHPEDHPPALDRWTSGLGRQRPFEMEVRLRRTDGAHRWFALRMVPLHDDHGAVVRWYGLASDIDDLKRAEELLHADVRDMSLILDNIPGLVYTMTPHGDVEFVNGRIREYFGRTLEELVDWEKIGVVHPDDLPLARAALDRTISFGDEYGPEQRLRRADGTYRWFQPRSLALRDAAGHVLRWYCLLVDVDDLKHSEEGLRFLQSRLSRATQLATVSELAASIAHEVNQPLAAVVANGHACRRWLSTTPPSVEQAALSADRIVRDGNAAAQVIERTRALFRNAPAQLLPLDLNEVIREVCALLTHDARSRQVKVVNDLEPDLPLVNADRIHMQQVLANLARNGIDALEGSPREPRELFFVSRADEAEVTVSVEDTGIGLASQDKIFDPFFTTKSNGLGVGLSICRSVVESHDGRLWAETNARGGATFRFSIPHLRNPGPNAGVTAP